MARGSIINSMKAIPGQQSPVSANQGLPGIGSAPLSPLARELDAGGPSGTWSSAYRAYLPRPANTFTDGAFGPFSPILPVPVDAPPEGSDLPDPRLFQYEVGWNLPVGQPGSEGIKLADFNTLRTLADVYSVARSCIQLRKSEIRSLEWEIMPTKEASKAMRGDPTAMRDFGERKAQAVKFFKKPDPDYFSWNTFIDALMEEVFVFDALSILFRNKWAKNQGRGLLGSDLDSLSLVSGQTIRPLLGLHGETPRPPAPAYQQFLYGVPRVDMMTLLTDRDLEDGRLSGADVASFKTDQMLYLPMTPRRWTPYGFPPIERALVPVMSGLQKQGYQLDYFREGTVPAVYISPGDANAMTPNQIRELQDALNAIAGDPAWKHKIVVLPAGSKVDPQRSPQLADQFDEVVMNQVCMAFDVMPMELGISPKVSTTQSAGAANQMSKMTSSISERKATKPTLNFLSDIFNSVLQGICGQEDMQFIFEGQAEEEDENTRTEMLARQVGTGLRSIDEAREELNLQPWGLPQTSDPGWSTTTTGFVTLDEASKARQAGVLAASAIGERPPTKPGPTGGPPGKPPEGSPAPSAQSPGHEAAEGHESQQSGSSEAGTGTKKAARPTNAGAARHQARRASRVDAISAKIVINLNRLVDQFLAGEVDANAATDRAVQFMHDGYFAAMTNAADHARHDHGAAKAASSSADFSSDAKMRAEIQRPFLSGLFKDLAKGNPGTMAKLKSRLAMYGRSLIAAYNAAFGNTVKAMGDYDIIWHTGVDELNCSACDERDGKKFTFDSLPGYPGDSDFGGYCLGGPNCHCSLEYIKHQDAAPVSTTTTDSQRTHVTDLRAAITGSHGVGQQFLSSAAKPPTHRELMANAKYRAVYAEMEAAARHLSKGLSPGDWNKRNVTDNELQRMLYLMGPGFTTYKEAARRMMATRWVDTNGVEFWTDEDVKPWSNPAGGGGPFLAPHDADGIYHAKSANEASGDDGDRRRLAAGVDGTAGDAQDVAHSFGKPAAGSRCVICGLVIDAEVHKNAHPVCYCCNGTGEHATGHECYRCDAGGTLYPPDEGMPNCDEVFRDPTVHDAGCPHCGQPGSQAGSTPSLITRSQLEAMASMKGDFPPEALVWMAFVPWRGPVPMMADELDMDDTASWAAHHEHAKVAKFAKKLLSGEEVRPILTVEKPGHDKVMVVDGHHRALAARMTGKPILAFVGKVPKENGPWNETHSYQRTEGSGGSEYSYQEKSEGPVAAGVCIVAEDTGRVLLLQRAYDEEDVAAGHWEFPGGCLEDGELPQDAAKREWSEETGMSLPEGAKLVGQWLSENGVYAGFIFMVAHEDELNIFDGRFDQVTNPDDPDGDRVEALAWWDPAKMIDNPAIREELSGDWPRVHRGILGD